MCSWQRQTYGDLLFVNTSTGPTNPTSTSAHQEDKNPAKSLWTDQSRRREHPARPNGPSPSIESRGVPSSHVLWRRDASSTVFRADEGVDGQRSELGLWQIRQPETSKWVLGGERSKLSARN